MFRYQTLSPWSCRRMWPFCSLPNRATSLNLLLAIAPRRSAESSSVLEHAGVVEIVVDANAAGYDAARVHADLAHVPFAGGFLDRLEHRRGHADRQDVVERRGLAVRPDLRVGMALVVDLLVLVADRRVHVLQHEILQPAVAALAHAPFPAQLEAIEGRGGDDVALATRVLAIAGIDRQQPVHHFPSRADRVGALVGAPAVERRAVEEEDPAVLLLGSRELIRGRGGRRRRLTDGRGCERGDGCHRRDRGRQIAAQVTHGLHSAR